jgi:pimeloyl-ACP methyl ester carboxylesterase
VANGSSTDEGDDDFDRITRSPSIRYSSSSPARKRRASRTGCGIVVCAFAVSLLLIMGTASEVVGSPGTLKCKEIPYLAPGGALPDARCSTRTEERSGGSFVVFAKLEGKFVGAEDQDTPIALGRAEPGPETVEDNVIEGNRIIGAEGVGIEVLHASRNRIAMAPACRAARAHYLCHIIRHDPIPVLERLRMPVLALYGELDPEVPPEPNVRLVSAALRGQAMSIGSCTSSRKRTTCSG